ncbi:MAG TPA: energy transducer TonB [Planktothrix sp.]|jgi:TonB family protein
MVLPKLIGLLITVITLLSLTQPALSFEPGLYSWQGFIPGFPGKRGQGAENPSITNDAVFDAVRNADRQLDCEGSDKIFIWIGDNDRSQPGEQVSQGSQSVNPIYFKRDELHEFLKRERHKEFLVISFAKLSMMWQGSGYVQNAVNEYKAFVSDLGYKRVLITGGHAFGIWVLYDSTNPNYVSPSSTPFGELPDLPDRILSCKDIDAISVGIGKPHHLEDGIAIEDRLFKRSELQEFLSREKYKNLLNVWFEKSIMGFGSVHVQEKLDEFLPFLSSLGYRRFVILGAQAFSMPVLYDSATHLRLPASEGAQAPVPLSLASPSQPSDDYGPYFADLQRRIKRAWKPPAEIQSERVVVSFTIDADGHISSLRLKHKSKLKAANKAALDAVRSAPIRSLPTYSTLPPPWRVQFTFDYKEFAGGGRAKLIPTQSGG